MVFFKITFNELKKSSETLQKRFFRRSQTFPSKKLGFIYFNNNPLKIMKNAFYSTLKAAFVLTIFNFLS